MDEKILVKLAKQGDVDAFGKLYEGVYKKLYRYAVYALHNEQDAQDAVSETVIDAFSSIRKLKSEEAFEGWIFKILANKCKKKMREYYVYGQEIDEENMPSEDSDPEERMDVRKCFFRLDQVESMIVAMHVLFGYKSRETAEILGLNENTVRSKEKRALEKMAVYLQEVR